MACTSDSQSPYCNSHTTRFYATSRLQLQKMSQIFSDPAVKHFQKHSATFYKSMSLDDYMTTLDSEFKPTASTPKPYWNPPSSDNKVVKLKSSHAHLALERRAPPEQYQSPYGMSAVASYYDLGAQHVASTKPRRATKGMRLSARSQRVQSVGRRICGSDAHSSRSSLPSTKVSLSRAHLLFDATTVSRN